MRSFIEIYATNFEISWNLDNSLRVRRSVEVSMVESDMSRIDFFYVFNFLWFVLFVCLFVCFALFKRARSVGGTKGQFLL